MKMRETLKNMRAAIIYMTIAIASRHVTLCCCVDDFIDLFPNNSHMSIPITTTPLTPQKRWIVNEV